MRNDREEDRGRARWGDSATVAPTVYSAEKLSVVL